MSERSRFTARCVSGRSAARPSASSHTSGCAGPGLPGAPARCSRRNSPRLSSSTAVRWPPERSNPEPAHGLLDRAGRAADHRLMGAVDVGRDHIAAHRRDYPLDLSQRRHYRGHGAVVGDGQTGHLPAAGADRLQRRPDHRARIRAPRQAPRRKQHMRAPAPPAPRPARHQQHIRALQHPHPPLPPVPPAAQHPAARRAPQLPARQLPPDRTRITVYREHDASKRQPSGPPQSFAKKITGRAAPDPTCSPCRPAPRKTTPSPPPGRIRNTSDVNPRPRRHLRQPADPVAPSSARCLNRPGFRAYFRSWEGCHVHAGQV